MRAFWAALILLALAIAWRAAHRHPPPAWQDPAAGKWLAARALSPGHQLSAADLKRPSEFAHRIGLPPIDSIVGLHLGPALPATAPITVDDLTMLPALPPSDSASLRFVVNLKGVDGAFGTLVQDSGWVLLCQGDRVSAGSRACVDLAVRIVAAHADSGARSPSWLVVEAPSCRANEIAPVLVSDKLKLFAVGGPSTAIPCPKPKVPRRRPPVPACTPQG